MPDRMLTLNNVPDANAQAMARGRTTSLGLIVHDTADPYFSSIAAGVMIAAEHAGLAVTLASTQHDPSREPRFVEVLTRQRALAIVIAGGRRDDSEADALMTRALEGFRRAGRSVALIGQPLLGVDTVVIENRTGAAALARALVDLGYRSFAVLSGPTNHLTARDRCAGFCEALTGLGCAVHPNAMITSDFTRDGGYDGMQSLLRQGTTAQIVFAVNDVMAVGAIAAPPTPAERAHPVRVRTSDVRGPQACARSAGCARCAPGPALPGGGEPSVTNARTSRFFCSARAGQAPGRTRLVS